MRFHILGIPHTTTSKEYLSCAFSQKVYKLCQMLTSNGHLVYHYGSEGSNPVCTENVNVLPDSVRSSFYDYDWKSTLFQFNLSDVCYRTFNDNAIKEISHRAQDKDFLLCLWGLGHKCIADHFNDKLIVVEAGIGYESTFAKFRVFESYSWMSYIYGKEGTGDGKWYDCVIPNFFDPSDFDYNDSKEDWFLYLGRLIKRKGIEIAVDVTKKIGAKLVIAGQGSLVNKSECLNIQEKHVDFVGYADEYLRRWLLSKAKSVFMPTYYIEPFGGVCIESAFSGTPVISTDWGSFAENILHGITGFRCRTFEQFLWAANNIHEINHLDCYEWALSNFTMDRIYKMYEEYFYSVLQMHTAHGWYSRNDSRTQLDWLKKVYKS